MVMEGEAKLQGSELESEQEQKFYTFVYKICKYYFFKRQKTN